MSTGESSARWQPRRRSCGLAVVLFGEGEGRGGEGSRLVRSPVHSVHKSEQRVLMRYARVSDMSPHSAQCICVSVNDSTGNSGPQRNLWQGLSSGGGGGGGGLLAQHSAIEKMGRSHRFDM